MISNLSGRITPQAKTYLILGVIILFGIWLRGQGMTFQSYWLDEIHTMNESSPSLTLAEIFHKKTIDAHPPLYFVGIHYWFKVFGYNDFNGRLFSVIAGVVGIIAIYFLGKEVKNERVGLIVAFLTSINYFHLFYSQEVRSYIFVFAFTSVSFLYLIRTIKIPTFFNGALYALTTVALMYTHYFGFACLGAQMTIIGVFFFFSKDRLHYAKIFSVAGLILFLLYLPWIKSLLLVTSRVKVFWLPAPKSDFFVTYFDAYFGDQTALILVFVFLIFVYLLSVFKKDYKPIHRENTFDPELFNFIVLALWIIISYGIPYIRSLVSIPMLGDRYTIITLPAILLIISLAIDQISSATLRAITLAFILSLFIVNIFLEKDYYKTKTKQEWREMTSFIKEKSIGNTPIISDMEMYMNYYFQTLGVTPDYLDGKNINSENIKEPDAIWVATAHGGIPIDKEHLSLIEGSFQLQDEFVGIDAWARRYVRRSFQDAEKLLGQEPNFSNVNLGLESVTKDATFLTIKGFAFLIDNPTKDLSTFIEIKSESSHQIFSGRRIMRGDVSAHFKDKNLGYSGFEFEIPVSKLTPNEPFEIYLVMKRDTLLSKTPLPQKWP